MRCRIVCLLLVVLVVASCSSGRSNRAGSGWAGPVSVSPSAQTLLRAYDIPPDDIPELGIALNPVPADRGLLIGPNFKFHVTQLGTTTELTSAQRQILVPWRPSPSPLPALSSHEYLVVVAERFGMVKDDGVEALFHVGGRDVVESMVGTLLIVETPVGGPVSVDITSAGRTQKMDLRTGRTSDLIDGYYPVRSAGVLIQCAIRITEPGVKVENTVYNEAAVDMGIDASLLPYIKDKGWAPAGRRWLLVQLYTHVISLDTNLTISVDLATDVKVTGPDGRLPIAGKPSVTGALTGSASRARVDHVFEVAAGAAALTASFNFSGVAAYAGKHARYSRQATSGAGGIKRCGSTNSINL
jgi:hypothetical protein